MKFNFEYTYGCKIGKLTFTGYKKGEITFICWTLLAFTISHLSSKELSGKNELSRRLIKQLAWGHTGDDRV